MKTSSAKAKGRNLQKRFVEKTLKTFSHLLQDDVTSRSMGAGGEDILLSPVARDCVPFSIECKSRASFAIYSIMEQADGQNEYPPLAYIKANRKEPLVILREEDFFKLLKGK